MDVGDIVPAGVPHGSRHRRLRTEWIALTGDILVIWDIVSITVVGYVCAIIYAQFLTQLPVSETFAGDTGGLSLLGGLLATFVLRDGQQSKPRRSIRYKSIFTIAQITTGRAVLLLGMVLAVMFLTRIGGRIPRLWLLLWALSTLTVTVGGRLVLAWNLRSMERRGLVRERVAVVGSGQAAWQAVQRLQRERGPCFELAGIFDDSPDETDHGGIADCARLVELGKQHELDWVILATLNLAPGRLSRIIHELKALDVQVAVCPQFMDCCPPNTEICNFGNLPMMLLVNRPIGQAGLLVKELTDKTLGLLLLIALAPLLIAIAVVITLDSRGPVIFRQWRHGRNNTQFQVLKFRTMRAAPPEATDGRRQTRREDTRITRVGGFLRASSLDELPQLFNVLRGDMSLVGPRPHPCEMRTEDRLSNEIIAQYAHRHRVKPGITGWAQINGYRGATESAEQVRNRIEYDLFYIENWSFLLDIKIMLLTPVKLYLDKHNAF